MNAVTSRESRPGLEYLDHPSFHDANQRQRILESIVGESDRERGGLATTAAGLLTAEEERSLFLKMNCLKFLASGRRDRAFEAEAVGGKRSNLRAARSLEAAARDVRDRIAAANLRLVRALAYQVTPDRQLREELVAEGHVVLLRVIDHFDVRYGFRFSTYATRALRREMARSLRKHTRTAQRVVPVPDLEPEMPADEQRPFDGEQISLVKEILASLPEREREILRERYGFAGGEKVVSYRKLSLQFGVSPERLRQLVERSFQRARDTYGDRLGLPF